MEAGAAGVLTDALTALLCKFSMQIDATKLQFALPLLLRLLRDLHEKRSSLALQVRQCSELFYSPPPSLPQQLLTAHRHSKAFPAMRTSSQRSDASAECHVCLRC